MFKMFDEFLMMSLYFGALYIPVLSHSHLTAKLCAMAATFAFSCQVSGGMYPGLGRRAHVHHVIIMYLTISCGMRIYEDDLT